MIANLLYNPFLKNLLELFKSKFIVLLQVVCAFLLPIKTISYAGRIDDNFRYHIWHLQSKKIHEPISSKKLSRIISKMLLYQCGLITCYVLEKFLLGEFIVTFSSIQFLLTKIIAVIFCGVEMMSLNENIKVVYSR